MIHLDLCCGVGGWQVPYKESNIWRSIGIDIQRKFEPDIVGDIQHLPVDASPTLLTASPPCTDFSRYAMPWCDESNPDTSLIKTCYEIVDRLEPDYWVIENVRGLKQYTGDTETKRVGPYYLWGEFPPFDVEYSTKGKMQISGANPEQRAKIPYEIADALRKSVEVWAKPNTV